MRIRLATASVVLLFLRGATTFAGARHFTSIYETTPAAPGGVELENWVTWRNANGADAVEFRHELEFGVTDHLTASLYLADWNYHDASPERRSGCAYDASAIELVYNLTNPVIDPVGLAIYQEYRIGDHELEWESKLIAQKNYGPLIVAYNATVEATWEGEREGEIQQSLGASYEIEPRLSVGIEAVHEFVFPDWRGKREMNLFLGPNVSYRRNVWWTTVTALAKATGETGEPDVQVRAIVGYTF
jgi:hypothetical protein